MGDMDISVLGARIRLRQDYWARCCGTGLRSGAARAVAIACLLTGAPAVAAEDGQPTALRPTAAPTHIEIGEAPVIDGDLSDPAWAKAVLLTEFFQSQPNTGEPVTERTEL